MVTLAGLPRDLHTTLPTVHRFLASEVVADFVASRTRHVSCSVKGVRQTVVTRVLAKHAKLCQAKTNAVRENLG